VTCEGRLLGGNRLLWTAVMTLTAVLPATGCSTVPGTRQPAGLLATDSASDQALRKRVEADKFPTANQAGVASASSQP